MGGAEDRVARVERKLETAEQITHIGSWEWSARDQRVTWSDELYRIYGLEPRASESRSSRSWRASTRTIAMRVQGEVRAAHRARRALRVRGAHRAPRRHASARSRPRWEAARDETGVFLGLHRHVPRRDRGARARCGSFASTPTSSTTCRSGSQRLEHEGCEDVGDASPLAYNPACGADRAEVARRRDRQVVPRGRALRGGRAARSALPRGARTTGSSRGDDRSLAAIRTHPTRALAIKVFPLPDHRLGLAIEDVTEQMVERRLQIAEQRVLEMIAEGAPLKSTLEALVLAIEDHSPPVLASVLLLDPDGAHVRSPAQRRACRRRTTEGSTARRSGRAPARAARPHSRGARCSSRTSSSTRCGTTTARSPARTACARAGRSRSSPPTSGCWGRSRSTTASRAPRPPTTSRSRPARRTSPGSRSKGSSSRTSSATCRPTSSRSARTSGPASRARSTTSWARRSPP